MPTSSGARSARRRAVNAIGSIAFAALLIVNCGSDTDTGEGDSSESETSESETSGSETGESQTGEPRTADEPGSEGLMDIAEAAGQASGSPATVEGFLIEDTGLLFVSQFLAESYPPQPGGATLQVEGFTIDADIAGLGGVSVNEVGAIRWLDTTVTVSGTIEDGRMVAARLVAAGAIDD